MSTLALSGPYSISTRSSNTGMSSLSTTLANKYDAARKSMASRVLTETVIGSLSNIFEECKESGWDGRNAKAVSASTFAHANRFLFSLPSSLPVPDVVPEPDGEIGFEWSKEPKRIFSVSISPNGLLSYAGLIGRTSKTHGTEIFDDTVPQVILDAIRRVYQN